MIHYLKRYIDKQSDAVPELANKLHNPKNKVAEYTIPTFIVTLISILGFKCLNVPHTLLCAMFMILNFPLDRPEQEKCEKVGFHFPLSLPITTFPN